MLKGKVTDAQNQALHGVNVIEKGTDIGAGTLFTGIIIAFTTGIVTILSQTLKAADSNPVDVLKYE